MVWIKEEKREIEIVQSLCIYTVANKNDYFLRLRNRKDRQFGNKWVVPHELPTIMVSPQSHNKPRPSSASLRAGAAVWHCQAATLAISIHEAPPSCQRPWGIWCSAISVCETKGGTRGSIDNTHAQTMNDSTLYSVFPPVCSPLLSTPHLSPSLPVLLLGTLLHRWFWKGLEPSSNLLTV